MAAKWTIDNVTDLIKNDDGTFSIMWAGAEFGPAATLAELAQDELLCDCEAAILTPGEVVSVPREPFLTDYQDVT